MPRGGNRGGGRPTAVNESIRTAVLDKSWSEIALYLNDESVSRKDKMKVAVYLAGKSVPQDVRNTIDTVAPITFKWADK